MTIRRICGLATKLSQCVFFHFINTRIIQLNSGQVSFAPNAYNFAQNGLAYSCREPVAKTAPSQNFNRTTLAQSKIPSKAFHLSCHKSKDPSSSTFNVKVQLFGRDYRFLVFGPILQSYPSHFGGIGGACPPVRTQRLAPNTLVRIGINGGF